MNPDLRLCHLCPLQANAVSGRPDVSTAACFHMPGMTRVCFIRAVVGQLYNNNAQVSTLKGMWDEKGKDGTSMVLLNFLKVAVQCLIKSLRVV
jgi:hypothetical protein